MSVAFRRESDEEHREPRFELPLPAGPNLVTDRGLKLICARAADLAAALAAVDEAGRAAIARDLRYWRTREVTAVVTPPPATGEIGLGSIVTIRLKGRERRLHLVGDDEADPAAGLIAWSAPLARVLIGAIAGEAVAFGGEPDAVEVLDVD